MSKQQCFCLTASGTRCKRYCQGESLKCFQHGKKDASTLRMLPSINLTAETSKPIISIDLTNDEPSSRPQRMETRLTRRRALEAQIQIITQVIDSTRVPREIREQRIKPRPPRRPRKSGDKHNHEHGHVPKEEDCCICSDDKVKEDRFLTCGHAICIGCIKQLRSDKCPMCRAEIDSKFISKTEKKRMQRRQRDDAEERNEEAYQTYMRNLIRESGGNASLFSDFL